MSAMESEPSALTRQELSKMPPNVLFPDLPVTKESAASGFHGKQDCAVIMGYRSSVVMQSQLHEQEQ